MEFPPEQLLGRPAVAVDDAPIRGVLEGRSVVVTGGGGSIGAELCRQIAARWPRRLTVVDIYENNAFAIAEELRGRCGDALDLRVIIASVRDGARMEAIFAAEKPDLVLHAAAHKHVPLMETSPGEAIKNNILGTENVVRAAETAGVGRFVLISTDKAVAPTSIMGASKRVCEHIVAAAAARQSATVFGTVRFGNVFGSNGSVVPLFAAQIARGEALTVTDHGMTRYFMTIPEAAELVLAAAAMATGGELFVLDMGEPVRIEAIARRMMALAGVDLPIRYTGLRPGERLHEVCLTDDPLLRPTACPSILMRREEAPEPAVFDGAMSILREAAAKADLTLAEAEEALRAVLPDFRR